MADQLLKELGISDGVTLHLNTLGDGDSREAWRAALVEHFRAVKGELSEDSQERLEKNPLRILDSKDPRDKAFVADAPKIDDYLSAEAQDFFAKVTEGLDAAGVAWERDPALVRGLDYYRHTAFEFVTRPPGRARHCAGRRAIRRADGKPRRRSHSGGRLGRGDRAAGDAGGRSGYPKTASTSRSYRWAMPRWSKLIRWRGRSGRCGQRGNPRDRKVKKRMARANEAARCWR